MISFRTYYMTDIYISNIYTKESINVLPSSIRELSILCEDGHRHITEHYSSLVS